MAFRLENGSWSLHTRGDVKKLALSDVVRSHPHAFYLYNLEDALNRADIFMQSGFSVHYAMKANSSARLLQEFAKREMGVDVVSLGEMQRALASGFSAQRLIFSGVAKDREELEAALQQNIFQINVESFQELQLLEQIARERHQIAPVGLRLNIHLTAPTHAHVQTATPDSKFGIDLEQMREILAWTRDKKWIRICALATHIGSQIQDLGTFTSMARKMGALYNELKSAGVPLERLDLGGGLGIDYQSAGENDPQLAADYLTGLKSNHGTEAQILVAPGRFLVARMGVLLARVIYVKQTSVQKFAILNAGMNFLMRPALYQAYHRISAVNPRREQDKYTVVGPICESTDRFALDRAMSVLERGDWVAIFDTGAYGATMANTYNEIPLPEQWSYLNGTWEVS